MLVVCLFTIPEEHQPCQGTAPREAPAFSLQGSTFRVYSLPLTPYSSLLTVFLFSFQRSAFSVQRSGFILHPLLLTPHSSLFFCSAFSSQPSAFRVLCSKFNVQRSEFILQSLLLTVFLFSFQHSAFSFQSPTFRVYSLPPHSLLLTPHCFFVQRSEFILYPSPLTPHSLLSLPFYFNHLS